MAKKITNETQQRLLRAIEKTAGFVNDGLDPNDAIVKAAGDCNVRVGEVNQLVHAFNTGRTARQRTASDDPLEKVADFQLADASTVLEKLYPSRVKTAAAVADDRALSTQYAVSPVGLLERRERREKVARHIDWSMGVEKPEAYPVDPNHRMKVASSDVDRLKREVEETRRQKAAAFDAMGATFMKLAEYFRSPGCKPIPVVRENVMLLHGDKGEQIMDELIKYQPGLTKLASHRTGESILYGRGVPAGSLVCDPTEPAEGAPYTIVNELVGQIGTYKQARDTHTEKEAEAGQQAEVLLGPFCPDALVSESILGPSSTTTKKAFSPLAALGTYSIVKNTAGGIAEGLEPPSESSLVQKNLDSLSDPEHEQQLRNIQAEATLQDLMVNDPVISAHEPEQVMTAYNDLVQVSPRSADQRLLMQSMLRKHLEQGSLDQFELDQMLGTEQKLQKRDAPTPAGGGAKPEINGVAADGSVL